MKHIALTTLLLTAAAIAQVPPKIAQQLVNIGRGVCAAQTAAIYGPLHSKAAYTGVAVARDLSFGPDPSDVVDVFSAEKGPGSRTVLIYVPGGAGNRQMGGADGAPFYDNVPLWATANGMVGVIMQRHAGQAWDDPAKDVARMVQWVGQNIGRYQGDPNRVFIWSQSAGNAPVATYIAHPELYGPKGAGVKAAVFMSSPGFSILPATPPATAGTGPCGQPDAPATAPPAAAAKGKGKAKGAAQPDDAVQLARSNLAGLIHSKLPFFVSAAELDPPSVVAFAETLRDQLCMAGRCPTYSLIKDHDHTSQVMSPGTSDTSVTGPILKWIQSVK